MRTTLDIDDRLMKDAQEFAPEGMTKTAIIEEGLRLFAQKQAQHAIARGAAYSPESGVDLLTLDAALGENAELHGRAARAHRGARSTI